MAKDFCSHPPLIAPLQTGKMPLWSVMIPVCNRLTYLEQAIRCVLDQDPGVEVMQIEIIDNSTNGVDVLGFIRDLAGGRVNYFKQPTHVPLSANWTTCIERARGSLIHLLHDDDYVADGFYAQFSQLAKANPDKGFFACRCLIVDEQGAIDSLTERVRELESASPDLSPLFYWNPFRCPGVVVRRNAYERCGGFNNQLTFTADWEMWIRVLQHRGGAFLNQPLAYYRLCATSQTADPVKAVANMRELLRMGEFFAAEYRDYDCRRFRRMISDVTLCRALELEEADAGEAAREVFELWREVAPYGRKAIALIKALAKGESQLFMLAGIAKWKAWLRINP